MGFTLPSPTSPAEQVRVLMNRKDALQAELDAQFSILSANKSTMNTPLLDPQGFPRADIDVWAVRHARVRVIELRNDMTALMDLIAKALEGIYDPALSAAVSQAAAEVHSSDGILKPFARVDGVAPGSPASAAGLLREDLVLKFGHLTSTSFTSSTLQPLAEFVAVHENRQIKIVVKRGSEETLTLDFTPRKGWGGRGMLGCHIVPYASP